VPTGLFVDEKNGDRGMVVFVDAQLRMSKRFDAAGLAEGSSQSIQAGIPKAKLVLGFRECPFDVPLGEEFWRPAEAASEGWASYGIGRASCVRTRHTCSISW